MKHTRQQTALTVVGLLLAIFLGALDQTVVATAGPAIQRSLHLGAASYSWLTTAYLVVSTVMVPIFGRLADVWGRRPVMLGGVAVFLVASLAAGLSASVDALIAARGLQGLGAAAIFTSAFTWVGDLFAPRERARYVGWLGAVFGVSSLLGPLLGGLVADTLGWPWVFFLNVPLGLVALLVLAVGAPAGEAPAAQGAVDLGGAALLCLGVGPLLLAASLGRAVLREGEGGYAWLSPQVLGLFALAVVGGAAFFAWERRAPAPLLDLTLFRDRTFAVGNLSAFLLGAVFLTPMVFLPLFMVNVVGVTHTASGLTISPLVLGAVVGNLGAGQLVSWSGRVKPLMLGALAVLLVGLWVMATTLSGASTQAQVTVKMVLLGMGLGPALPLYTLAVQTTVDAQRLGVGTSMTTFSRQLGATLGVAVAGSLFATTSSGVLAERLAAVERGLPPQVVARLERSRSAGEEASGGPVFDAPLARARLEERLTGARTVAVRALGGDGLSAVLVEQSEFADEALRAAVAGGGVPARVHARYQRWAGVERAEALGDLALPQALRRRLEAATEHGEAEAVAAAEAEETAAELATATAAVDRTVASARVQFLNAIDGAEGAFKEAFAQASRDVFWLALALAVLALLSTLALPEVSLQPPGGPHEGR